MCRYSRPLTGQTADVLPARRRTRPGRGDHQIETVGPPRRHQVVLVVLHLLQRVPQLVAVAEPVASSSCRADSVVFFRSFDSKGIHPTGENLTDRERPEESAEPPGE